VAWLAVEIGMVNRSARKREGEYSQFKSGSSAFCFVRRRLNPRRHQATVSRI
jgi:hypothetical protein